MRNIKTVFQPAPRNVFFFFQMLVKDGPRLRKLSAIMRINFQWIAENLHTYRRTLKISEFAILNLNSDLLTYFRGLLYRYWILWTSFFVIADLTKFIVWNIYCLRHWVAKMLGLENKSLWQRPIPRFILYSPLNF